MEVRLRMKKVSRWTAFHRMDLSMTSNNKLEFYGCVFRKCLMRFETGARRIGVFLGRYL